MTSTPPAHALAGKPAPANLLVDLPKLITAYYTWRPDPSVAAQRVAFGTSGHRGVFVPVAASTKRTCWR